MGTVAHVPAVVSTEVDREMWMAAAVLTDAPAPDESRGAHAAVLTTARVRAARAPSRIRRGSGPFPTPDGGRSSRPSGSRNFAGNRRLGGRLPIVGAEGWSVIVVASGPPPDLKGRRLCP